MVRLLDDRREQSTKRLDALRSYLSEAAKLAEGKACVYVTGSFGRGEASPHSDLDLFIVGRGTEGKPELSKLDQICLKADLIAATRKEGFPPFSGDGEYLEHYTIEELTSKLGLPDDDSENTLTARLLLLLESRPLIGQDIYRETIDQVIAKYWGDYEDHRDDFMPAFLANDILRLWRTFCLNYEARTRRDPPEKKAKRRLKNYKLKHSRLLTCFSALAYLLAVFRRDGTVSPGEVTEMVKLSPTERLVWLERTSDDEGIKQRVTAVLDGYEEFLQRTNRQEDELVADFMDSNPSREAILGDRVYELLSAIGKDSRFYRILVV